MKKFKFIFLLLFSVVLTGIFSCSTPSEKKYVTSYHVKYFTIKNGTSDNLLINIMTLPDSTFFGEFNLAAGDSHKYVIPEGNVIPWATSETNYKTNNWSYSLQPINFTNCNEMSFTWTTAFIKNNIGGVIKKIKQPSVSF
jgi:hypothetical protein